MFILNDTWAFPFVYVLLVWNVLSEITQATCSWSELGNKLLQEAWNIHTHMLGIFNCHWLQFVFVVALYILIVDAYVIY